MVRRFSGRDAFAEADGVRREADISSLDQLDRKGQLRITLDAARFLLSLRNRLVQAEHGRHARRGKLLGNQQVGGNPVLRFAADHQVSAGVALQFLTAQFPDLDGQPLQVG